MTTHAYILTENTDLSDREITAVAKGLAQAVDPAASAAHELLTVVTSADGKTTITEALFDEDLLAAWLSKQARTAGVSVIDFFEPLTVVEKDEEGRDVVRVQHKTRKDAAAAAARRWLAENRAFSRVPEEELYSQPTFLAELVELVNLASAELIKFLKTHPHELDKLGSRQFEELIAEILASYKWDVQLTPATRDGGYDIFAINKDISGLQQSWIIECKKYREDRKVGVDIVRQLFSVKDDLRVGNALLATTSHFTAGVEKYKDSRYDLELKDREGILRWIDEYHPKKGGLYLRDSGLKLPGKDG